MFFFLLTSSARSGSWVHCRIMGAFHDLDSCLASLRSSVGFLSFFILNYRIELSVQVRLVWINSTRFCLLDNNSCFRFPFIQLEIILWFFQKKKTVNNFRVNKYTETKSTFIQISSQVEKSQLREKLRYRMMKSAIGKFILINLRWHWSDMHSCIYFHFIWLSFSGEFLSQFIINLS